MRGVDAAVRQLGYKVHRLRRRAWRARGVELRGEFLIDRTAHVTGGVVLGAHCRVRRNVSIVGPRVTIGSWAYINDGTYIASDVSLGERVAVSQFCRFITGTHEPGGSEHRAGATVIRPIAVGDGVWIGACSTILPGGHGRPGIGGRCRVGGHPRRGTRHPRRRSPSDPTQAARPRGPSAGEQPLSGRRAAAGRRTASARLPGSAVHLGRDRRVSGVRAGRGMPQPGCGRGGAAAGPPRTRASRAS